MASTPDARLSEFMHGANFRYSVLLVGVPLMLVLRRCRATLRELVLRMAAACIALATVYTPNHVLVDAAAGLGIALVAQFCVVALLLKRRAGAVRVSFGTISVHTA